MFDGIRVVQSVWCVVWKEKVVFLLGLELGIVKGIIVWTAKGKNEGESEEFF